MGRRRRPRLRAREHARRRGAAPRRRRAPAVPLLIAVAIALLAAGAGAAFERCRGDAARALSRRLLDALLWVAMPFVIFFSLAHLHVGGRLGLGLLLAYAELALVTALAWLVAAHVLRLSRPATGALIVGVLVVNTGYLGLPLVGSLLGAHALGPAILYDATVSTPWSYAVGFAVGAALGTGGGRGGGTRMRAFLVRNPPLWALLAALVAPGALAPAALVSAAHALVYVSAAAAFFAVGINLMQEGEDGALAFPPPLTPAVLAALGLRLLLAPGLLALASLLLLRVPSAYLIQAAMPSGLTGLLIAHVHGLDVRLICAVIFWSNLAVLAVVTVAALA